MVNQWWNQLPHKFTNIELNDYFIMPNHLPGIISAGADPRVCPETKLPAHSDHKMDRHARLQQNPLGEHGDSQDIPLSEHVGSPLQGPISLSRMVQWFKTMTTNEYICHVKQNDWQNNITFTP